MLAPHAPAGEGPLPCFSPFPPASTTSLCWRPEFNEGATTVALDFPRFSRARYFVCICYIPYLRPPSYRLPWSPLTPCWRALVLLSAFMPDPSTHPPSSHVGCAAAGGRSSFLPPFFPVWVRACGLCVQFRDFVSKSCEELRALAGLV